MARSAAGMNNTGLTVPSMGRRYTASGSKGNFTFRLPKITSAAFTIPHAERLALLADFKVPQQTLANRFKVDKKTANKWRNWLSRLAEEKPTLISKLLAEPLYGQVIAKQYYAHGSNWLRLNYGLTNVGTRGLILWLVAGQHIDKISTARRR